MSLIAKDDLPSASSLKALLSLLISLLLFILKRLISYDSWYLMLRFYFSLDQILYLITKPIWFHELENTTQTWIISDCASRSLLNYLGYISSRMFQCKFYKILSYCQIYWTEIFLSLKDFLSRGTLFTVFLNATALQIYKDSLVLCFPIHTKFVKFVFLGRCLKNILRRLLCAAVFVCMVIFLYHQQVSPLSLMRILLPSLHKLFLTEILKLGWPF